MFQSWKIKRKSYFYHKKNLFCLIKHLSKEKPIFDYEQTITKDWRQ